MSTPSSSPSNQPVDPGPASAMPLPGAGPHRTGGGPHIDPQQVDQTRAQIRQLASQIADLVQASESVEEFFPGYLTRIVRALASRGAAIWRSPTEDAPLTCQYHVNLTQHEVLGQASGQQAHAALIQRLLEDPRPALIGPDDPANPTTELLILAPLRIPNGTWGLLEVVQRADAGPATQQGYLRFVSQMADLASEFLRGQQLRELTAEREFWQQLEQFTRQLHAGLDGRRTAYTLANEGRRLLDCDRVSVAIGSGRGCQIEAVSGLDSIERRADQIKQLTGLARAVIRSGQPLWYHDQSSPLPPQLESRLHHYVDRSHTQWLAILPLAQPQEVAAAEAAPRGRQAAAPPLGALIIEQLADAQPNPRLQRRSQWIAEHAELALANVSEHRSIFLLPLWKLLGRCTYPLQVGQRWKTATVLSLVAAVAAALTWIPYPFALHANGRLVPQLQYEVFAQADGTMTEVLVSDTGDTLVEAGQPLGRMTNSDIELAISSLNGQIAEAQSQITIHSRRLSMGQLELDERVELESRILRDRQTVASLQHELAIRQQEQQRLTVISPAAGRVVNWNVRQSLLNRPVQLGQNLMTIVPPDTRWELELEMPERRVAHLIRALGEQTEPLPVTFGLVSNPGTEYTGHVLMVDRKLDVYSDEGNAVLVRVAFDNDQLPAELLRSETRVSGQVQCDQRALGYVMFHEFFETVHGYWLMWF